METTTEANHQKIRKTIPWFCFAVVIIYGQITDNKRDKALEARAVWMEEVQQFQLDILQDLQVILKVLELPSSKAIVTQPPVNPPPEK